MSRAVTTAGLALAVALLGGCQSIGAPGTDKAGNDTLVVRMATPDGEANSNGEYYGPERFVQAVEEISGGRLVVDIDATTYTDGSPDAESRIVEALAAGELDAGWPSTRAFAAAGIPGLEIVEAPLTITSYDAQRDLVTSPVADDLLSRLEGTGVRGLGLAVGPLRRPFAAEAPLLGLEDWTGQPFRSFNSPVQDAAIVALGAEPVAAGSAWTSLVSSGDLRGLEFDIAQYLVNGMTTQAGHVTSDVVLWPKVFVLSVSEQFYESLSPQQQDWLQQAAEAATQASIDGDYDRLSTVRALCELGVQFHEAGEQRIAELTDAVQPVLDDLSEDPALAEVRSIGERHPADALTVPDGCDGGALARVGDPGPIPDDPAGIPDGTYRVEITEADLAASGLGEPGVGQSGTWTLTIDSGDFRLECAVVSPPGGTDCEYAQRLPSDVDWSPRYLGAVTGRGDIAVFVNDPRLEEAETDCRLTEEPTPDSCAPSSAVRVRWSLDGISLTFSDQVAELSPAYFLVLEPWQKIDG